MQLCIASKNEYWITPLYKALKKNNSVLTW